MSYPPQDPYGQPAAPGGQGVDPGDGLGNVGKILSIIPCTYVIGFIISLVARSQSKAAGFQNRHFKTSMIFCAIWLVVSIVGWIIYAVVIAAAINNGYSRP
ncbi:MAG: hypothetical protein ACR2I1_06870 [Propionibacteriaceae bacterium]